MGLVMGFHTVSLRCPDCKTVVPIEMEMRTVRTHVSDAEATTLKLKVAAKAVDHRCNEPTLFDGVDR